MEIIAKDSPADTDPCQTEGDFGKSIYQAFHNNLNPCALTAIPDQTATELGNQPGHFLYALTLPTGCRQIGEEAVTMKLDRLTWTTRTSNFPTSQNGRAATGHPLSPVESASPTESDRRRSLQEDLDGIEAKALGNFEGMDQVLHNAQEIAEKLTSLGTDVTQLVRSDKVLSNGFFIDEE